MSATQKFTLVLDSSQISTFLECPQKYVNQYVKRLVPLAYDPSVEATAMNAGTYGHKLLDIYYRNKVKRLSLNDNIQACMDYNPDTDTCECGCMYDCHRALKIGGCEIQECQRCHKCAKFRPRPFPLNSDVRAQVRNRFKDYVFKYQHNDLMPLSEKHVEIGFAESVYEDSDNLFVLEGRIDMIAEIQGVKVCVDHKFQMQTHWLYPNSIQFKNYAMVSGCNTFMINYVRLAKMINDTTMVREIVPFTQFKLNAWKQRLIKIFWNIKSLMLDSQNNVRQFRNWDACSGYGKTFQKDQPKYCWYGQLCEEPFAQTEVQKENMLYKIQKEVWRPW
jgi:PD-(D/E)XK nuclease superfamily